MFRLTKLNSADAYRCNSDNVVDAIEGKVFKGEPTDVKVEFFHRADKENFDKAYGETSPRGLIFFAPKTERLSTIEKWYHIIKEFF